MTKKRTEAGSAEVRLLVDCEWGRCGRTVTLPAEVVARLVADGSGDTDPAAVAAGKE